MQQSHQRLVCLPCACACVCVGARGDTSCVFVQEDGEEHRLVYAAYHPCATRKVPCPRPLSPSPLPFVRAPSLSACLMVQAARAGSAVSASGRRGAQHMCQAPALCVTLVLPPSCTRTRSLVSPFSPAISLLTDAWSCLGVSSCLGVCRVCDCCCVCVCVCPGMWRCRRAGRGVWGRRSYRTR